MKFIKNPRYVLLFVLVITVFAIAIDLPRIPVKYQYKDYSIDTEIGGYQLEMFGGRIQRDLEIKQGLDIAGGVSVLLSADMSEIPEADRAEALSSLRDVIERRVNLLGISEATVQTSRVGDEYRVIVELAGVFDTTQALDTVGEVAQLEFRIAGEPIFVNPNTGEIITEETVLEEGVTPISIPNFEPTDLTGADLRKASAAFGQTNSGTNEPQIQLQFNADGVKKFRKITEDNVGKQVAIYLDEDQLIAPVVQQPITDGRAVITGQFTLDEAKAITAQLNAGALPVPVEVLEQRTVGPTLGQESVNKSIYAGMVGLLLVMGFMIAYYGWLGFFACISLAIYGLITLALYKSIPVVLTLPGLAGFILSIGMAVDANILIFERTKEELRMGKPMEIALENGFGRSWESIRDANVATLITAFILFNPFNWAFLPTSGPVRGFALTLSLGILISLFTGVFITRNLVRVFYKPKKVKKVKKEKKEKKND